MDSVVRTEDLVARTADAVVRTADVVAQTDRYEDRTVRAVAMGTPSATASVARDVIRRLSP